MRNRACTLLILFGLCRLPFIAQMVPEPEPAQDDRGAGFRWNSALLQSSLFLGIQHAFRIATEPGTRAELKGPFWRDYARSLKGIRGWGDEDPFIVNYVGHPFMGAVTNYIQIQNDSVYNRARFGRNELYWRSRLRALSYTTAYSTLFELGPAGEASIGNVGLDGRTMGFVDLVMTPVGGLGVTLAEDSLDRHVVERIEQATGNRIVRAMVRAFLNPNRSFANALRAKYPWYRDTRPGINVR